MKSLLSYYFPLIFISLLACSQAGKQYCNHSAIITYVINGDTDNIRQCYKSGARVLIADSLGNSVYALARQYDHQALALYLQQIQLADWQERGEPYQAQYLYDAIAYNNTGLVSRFVTYGFDLKAKHIDGVAPVVWAVFNNSNAVLVQLLEQGVEVNYEFDSRPLICIAAMFNQQETVEILLAYGADINNQDGSGVTPLMFAARDGSADLVKLLLSRGADAAVIDIKGQTAMTMAKGSNQNTVVDLLVE